jgi:hypothetical protein
MPVFAREQHIDYFLFTAADFHRDLPDAERAEVRQILASDPNLTPLYRSPLSSILELAPQRAIPDTNRVQFRTPDAVKTAAHAAAASSNSSGIQSVQ